MVVVIGILTAMIAFGAFVGMDAYRSALTHSERDTIVGLLARARSSAMANTYQTLWGLCYIAPNYIVFRGTTCAAGTANNEITPAATDAVVTGLSAGSPIVFSELAGTSSPATLATPTTITITQQDRVSTIIVNYEGAIQ